MINNKMVGLIAAVDINGLIGYDGKIPWNNPVDLRRFKALTMGHTLIMGRKTYESLPGSKLPGRYKHVLSREKKNNTSDTKWFVDLVKAIEDSSSELIWIVGGAQIYKEAMNLGIPDFIDLSIISSATIISDDVKIRREKSTHMPRIPYTYQVASESADPEDKMLFHRKYIIRKGFEWKK